MRHRKQRHRGIAQRKPPVSQVRNRRRPIRFPEGVNGEELAYEMVEVEMKVRLRRDDLTDKYGPVMMS